MKSERSKGGCVNLMYKSVPNADKGDGVKKSESFADIISGSSLSEFRVKAHFTFFFVRPTPRARIFSAHAP